MTSPPPDCASLCSFREPTRAYCVQNSRRSCPVVHQETPLFGPPLIVSRLRLTAAARRKNSSPENLTHLHYNLLGKDSRVCGPTMISPRSWVGWVTGSTVTRSTSELRR